MASTILRIPQGEAITSVAKMGGPIIFIPGNYISIQLVEIYELSNGLWNGRDRKNRYNLFLLHTLDAIQYRSINPIPTTLIFSKIFGPA